LRPVVLAAVAFAAGYVLHSALMGRWLHRMGFDSVAQLEDDLADLSEMCGSLLKDQELDRPAYRIRPRDMN